MRTLVAFVLGTWWFIRGTPPDVLRAFNDEIPGACPNRKEGIHCYCYWNTTKVCCDCEQSQ